MRQTPGIDQLAGATVASAVWRRRADIGRIAMPASKRITKLLPEQEARFGEFVEKWVRIGLCTDPADRPRAEAAIKGLYALARLREPRVIWLSCPLSAALSAVVYAKLIQKRLVPGASAGEKKTAVDSAVGSAGGPAGGPAGGSGGLTAGLF